MGGGHLPAAPLAPITALTPGTMLANQLPVFVLWSSDEELFGIVSHANQIEPMAGLADRLAAGREMIEAPREVLSDGFSSSGVDGSQQFDAELFSDLGFQFRIVGRGVVDHAFDVLGELGMSLEEASEMFDEALRVMGGRIAHGHGIQKDFLAWEAQGGGFVGPVHGA